MKLDLVARVVGVAMAAAGLVGAAAAQPANDHCFTSIDIGDGSYPFDTTDAITEFPEYNCGGSGFQGTKDIWYRYNPTEEGIATISTAGSSFDTTLAVYLPVGLFCPPNEATDLLACNDDFGGMLQSQVTITVTPGSSYLIRLGGFNTFAGPGTLTTSVARGVSYQGELRDGGAPFTGPATVAIRVLDESGNGVSEYDVDTVQCDAGGRFSMEVNVADLPSVFAGGKRSFEVNVNNNFIGVQPILPAPQAAFAMRAGLADSVPFEGIMFNPWTYSFYGLEAAYSVGLGTQGGELARPLQVGTTSAYSEGLIRLEASMLPYAPSNRRWEVGVPNDQGFIIPDPAAFDFVICDVQDESRRPGFNPNFAINWSNGYVGINTGEPLFNLHVVDALDAQIGITGGAGRHWTMQSSNLNPGSPLDGSFQIVDRSAGASRVLIDAFGNMGVGTTDPQGFKLAVNGSAAKPGGGSWSVLSDERVKKNIVPVTDALNRLLSLRGIEFSYREEARDLGGPGRFVGFRAQEVEKVFPNWVTENAQGTKFVTEQGTTALTVEALRELRAEKDRQIEELKAQNESLQKRLAALEAAVAASQPK